MVLEHIFPDDWLEHKGRYSFILGVVYSIIGVLIASALFPGDPALVAVAITSMLLMPELYKVFSVEERKESSGKKFSLQNLFLDDFDIIKVYIFVFLGIIFVYSVGTILLPSMQTNLLFREQLEIRFGEGFAGQAIAGQAVNSGGEESIIPFKLFLSLLSNNFMVLMACFIISLLCGDGAIFLISWNASVWGTIFGITAKLAGEFSGHSVFALFGVIMLIVFPHMIIEGMCYFLAAISGSIISKGVVTETFGSDKFWEVFSFNLYLLLVGLFFLVLGAGVEAFVLQNVDIYHEIIKMSMSAAKPF
jgi:hypothetical protein